MQRYMMKLFMSNPASSECLQLDHKFYSQVPFHVFFFSLHLTRDAVSSHGPVLLQPLLHHPHDGQYVRPVDIFFGNRVALGEGAVYCILPFCR